ncbi:hypothetical protein IR083_20885 [Dysgonomonas sp. GY75]|uniref:hypothetical protein n=1 Tax=Dysgonomonas sp. GY75 TaxID=2780419 RepID=UPI0018835AD9|nr:hypothetical protein [Dysgonomonas sp. GY75]MBF0651278.1 hypothetical protein [Dysgonomonas sp. GY75]
MKNLKHKIEEELHKYDAAVALDKYEELDEDTLDMVTKLAKAYHYLHKACELMEGKQDPEVQQFRKPML